MPVPIINEKHHRKALEDVNRRRVCSTGEMEKAGGQAERLKKHDGARNKQKDSRASSMARERAERLRNKQLEQKVLRMRGIAHR
jgi:hypothetical protein